MLKADIEKADHCGWIDARKENISELQGQFADYQKLQTQYTNDLNGFLKDLASLEKSQANAPLDEKRGNLEALLNALPKPLGLENRLAPHQNAISKLDPSIQRDADMLNADFQELDTSRSLWIPNSVIQKISFGTPSQPRKWAIYATNSEHSNRSSNDTTAILGPTNAFLIASLRNSRGKKFGPVS